MEKAGSVAAYTGPLLASTQPAMGVSQCRVPNTTFLAGSQAMKEPHDLALLEETESVLIWCL